MIIMVPYDGSEHAKKALKKAMERSKMTQTEIYVVTSIITDDRFHAKEKEDAQRNLEEAQSICDEKDVFCKTHLLSRGMTPEEDLIQFAKENGVDEIVIGIKKRSKLGKFILGSTAQHLILNAECPVLSVS